VGDNPTFKPIQSLSSVMPLLEIGFVTVAAMWVALFAAVAEQPRVESFVKSSWAVFVLVEIGAPGAIAPLLGGLI